VKHPKTRNTRQNKSIATKGLINFPHPTDVIKPRDLCRIVLDLKVKDNSYNEIIDFCLHTLQIHISKEQIMEILIDAGNRAKHLNGIYDELVQALTKIVVLDEVFQGKSNCIFGCADAGSHYLFCFENIAHRSEEAIRSVFQGMGLSFDNLKLAITDGLASYPAVIAGSLESVIHVLCQVHAYRIILREQDTYHRAVQKAYTAIKDAKAALVQHRDMIHRKQQEVLRKKKRMDRVVQKRAKYHKANGIKLYSKKSPMTDVRLAFKAQLDNLRMGIKSQMNTISNLKKKTAALQKALFDAEQEYLGKKQISLQTGRLVHQFHRLIKCTPDDFPREKIRIDKALVQSNYPIAIKIRTFLKDHPALLVTKTKELDAICPPSVATTNIIEGIFGLLRPLLTKARRFHETLVAKAFFEIVRFHYNFSSPFTGINKGTSPLERAGVHSKYKNYLDALYPEDRQNICINGRALVLATSPYYEPNTFKVAYEG
jgi:hypothetical protein